MQVDHHEVRSVILPVRMYSTIENPCAFAEIVSSAGYSVACTQGFGGGGEGGEFDL